MYLQENLGRIRDNSNLYEIPVCSICIQDLSKDIMTLPCGHCFHAECIRKHLQRYAKCPYCMRACREEPRKIHFNVIKDQIWEKFLESFELENRKLKCDNETFLKQVVQYKIKEEQMRKELKQCMAKIQIVQESSKEIQITFKTKLKNAEEQVKELTDQLSRQKNRITILKNELTSILADYQDTIHRQMKLRKDLEIQQNLTKNYQNFRKYNKYFHENFTQINEQRIKLQRKGISSEEIVKIFCNLLLLSNLHVKKLKEQYQGVGEKIVSKGIQISKLQSTVSELQIELREARYNKAKESRKYYELKVKFNQLSEKARVMGVTEIPQLEDSKEWKKSIFGLKKKESGI